MTSLAEQGFGKIVVWRGCGGHDPYHDIWCRLADASVPGGHADSFTTSIVLHLRPESVLKDKIVDPDHAPVDWSDPDLDFSLYSPTGVIGDPTHASAQLGAKLWEAVIAAAASTFQSVGE